MDDSFNIRKKNTPDKLFAEMNNQHANINFTVEINPTKFLNTEIVTANNKVETRLIYKMTKLPTHWSTKTPKRYKRNAINGNLHRAWMISSNFESEVKIIKQKYLSAGYPEKFVNSTIKSFRDKIKNRSRSENFFR